MKIVLYQDNYYKLPSHFKCSGDIRSLKSRKMLAEVLEKNSIIVNNFNTSNIIKLIDTCTDNENSIILKTTKRIFAQKPVDIEEFSDEDLKQLTKYVEKIYKRRDI